MPLFVLVLALGACRTASVGQAPGTAAMRSLFGPVIAQEVITGRADLDREVALVANGTELLAIDLQKRSARRATIQVPPGKECWGLARLSDGSLWTLEDRHTAIRVDDRGAVLARLPLAGPHFGLFAAGDRLAYQEANFTPPGPALYVSGSIEASRAPWTAITTRAFPSLARASVAALNLLTCGETQSAERACWFPDEPAVSLVQPDGGTRRVVLQGIAAAVPEQLLTSNAPRRPVRDAYVDARRDLWILSSGAPPEGTSDLPGGWLLAKYAFDGTPRGMTRLPEAARLVLAADPAHITLLLTNGHVAEIDRW
jgi:hypothetical protein